MAELFLFSGSYPQGCSSFGFISPNIVMEETGIKDDSGMQDVQYTEVCSGTNKWNEKLGPVFVVVFFLM